MDRRRLRPWLLFGVIAMSGCSSGASDPADPSSRRTTTPPIATAEERALAACARRGTAVAGSAENPELDEASGLVSSREYPGVIWSHNDGDARPGLFAIDADGSDLGVHPLDVADIVDVEDIARVGGDTGDDLLLADIGDNGAERQLIRVFRFAEPDPRSPAPIDDISILEFRYPDRPHNAETLLVDEAADRIVIVTKEQAAGRVDGVGATEASFVFTGPLDGHDGGVIELEPVGMLDTLRLEDRNRDLPPHPATLLGFGGVPTGGDVSADGALIALRTYETVWLWARSPGQEVSEALAGEPCQVATASERQGEAVAFDGDALVTLGEGVGQPLNLLAR